MTLVWNRLRREKIVIAMVRFMSGSEDLEDSTSRLCVFSRVWFVLYAIMIPLIVLVMGMINFEIAMAMAAGVFMAGALFMAWCLAGGLDRIVYEANKRLANERRPWWNRTPE